MVVVVVAVGGVYFGNGVWVFVLVVLAFLLWCVCGGLLVNIPEEVYYKLTNRNNVTPCQAGTTRIPQKHTAGTRNIPKQTEDKKTHTHTPSSREIGTRGIPEAYNRKHIKKMQTEQEPYQKLPK